MMSFTPPPKGNLKRAKASVKSLRDVSAEKSLREEIDNSPPPSPAEPSPAKDPDVPSPRTARLFANFEKNFGDRVIEMISQKLNPGIPPIVGISPGIGVTPTGPPDGMPAIPIPTGIAVPVLAPGAPPIIPPEPIGIPTDQRVSLMAYRKITVLSDNHAKTVCISILHEVESIEILKQIRDVLSESNLEEYINPQTPKPITSLSSFASLVSQVSQSLKSR